MSYQHETCDVCGAETVEMSSHRGPSYCREHKNTSCHYLFVGGPADNQLIPVQNDPEVFSVDFHYDSEIVTHEYIRQREPRRGIIYVHKDTSDMWEFEWEIEEAQRKHKGMTKAEFDELYMCNFEGQEDI